MHQNSSSDSSNSTTQQDKPDIWQEWGYGFLYAFGLGAYESAVQNGQEHPQ